MQNNKILKTLIKQSHYYDTGYIYKIVTREAHARLFPNLPPDTIIMPNIPLWKMIFYWFICAHVTLFVSFQIVGYLNNMGCVPLDTIENYNNSTRENIMIRFLV